MDRPEIIAARIEFVDGGGLNPCVEDVRFPMEFAWDDDGIEVGGSDATPVDGRLAENPGQAFGFSLRLRGLARCFRKFPSSRQVPV